ncbi:unnamed protein product [Protopolystoma xenopodis]|uniref:Uncharacterized protein n=1 Tax=Protopolystoma xenopodis TaxID=117903 RepID=A0A448XKP3_9PLAT|nr:unnamed protein product [Protopolystoma xenopodis]
MLGIMNTSSCCLTHELSAACLLDAPAIPESSTKPTAISLGIRALCTTAGFYSAHRFSKEKIGGGLTGFEATDLAELADQVQNHLLETYAVAEASSDEDD